MTSDEAEEIAIAALGFLAAEPERIGAFLATAGADAEDLRARAGDPTFLGFVLDHLLTDDAAVLAFAEGANLRPEAVMRARQALPGGDVPAWT
ncbi:MAG: DUF3572 domain-containing protein [Pseudomonadota bacterium]